MSANARVLRAVEAKDFNKVRALLPKATPAEINYANKFGTTPLIAAASSSDLLVESLLERNARVRDEDDKGNTALHFASKSLTARTVTMLVSAGAQVMARNDAGDTPLHYAVRNRRNEDVAFRLLSLGAFASALNKKGLTPFHVAIDNAAVDISRRLLETWKPRGLVFRTGEAPGEEGHEIAGAGLGLFDDIPTDVLLQMLKLLPSVDLVSLSLTSKSMYLLCHQPEIWHLCRFDVDNQCTSGKTPLILAIEKAGAVPKFQDIVDVLVAGCADLERPDKFGRKPLVVAVLSMNVQSVSLLLSCGADCGPDSADRDGRGPLDHAELAISRGISEANEIATLLKMAGAQRLMA